MPGIGMVLTGLLWVNLHEDAQRGGLVRTAIGLIHLAIIYLAIITKGFRKKVVAFDENQAVTGYNKVVKVPLDER